MSEGLKVWFGCNHIYSAANYIFNQTNANQAPSSVYLFGLSECRGNNYFLCFPHPFKFLCACPDLRTLACKTLLPQGAVLLGRGTWWSLGLVEPVSLGKAAEKQQFAPSVVLYWGREGYLGAAIRARWIIQFFSVVSEVEQLKECLWETDSDPFLLTHTLRKKQTMKIHFICLGSFHFPSCLCMSAHFLSEKSSILETSRKNKSGLKFSFSLLFSEVFLQIWPVCLCLKPAFEGREMRRGKSIAFMNNFPCFHPNLPWTSVCLSLPESAEISL